MPYVEVSDESFSKLSYGVHDWKLNYSGDDEYNPASISGTFEYTFMDLDFPEIVNDNSFSVQLPDGAQGNIILYVDGKKISTTKYETDDEEECYIPIEGFSGYGKHTYKVVYSGDSQYPEYAIEGEFEYDFITFSYDEEIDYGNASYLDIDLPEDISGNIEIYVNGKLYKKVAASEDVSIDIDRFNVGDNNVTFKYTGSKKYPARSYSYLVTATPTINVDYEITFTDKLIASLILPGDAKGTLVAELNGEKVAESVFRNGKAVIELSDFSFNNEYNLVVYYNGTDYEVEENEGEITVLPKVILPDFAEGIKYVSFELPSDATGNLRMILDDEDLDVDFANGKAKVDLSKLIEYETPYTLQISYSGNYPEFEDEFDIDMEKPIPNISVDIPSKIIAGNAANIVFNLPKDAKGSFTIYDDDDIYEYADASKGKATVKLVFPKGGTFTVYYDYECDDNYQDVSGNFTVVVLPPCKITASSLTMSYSDGSVYKVRVFDNYGKPVTAGKQVTFKINGKAVKTVKTDKNGYASFKPNLLPGTYKITTTAMGVKTTKSITVKRILSLTTVNVKKSAKKLVFQANLAKVKGKYLNDKQITFKFNGVKIGTAKTNAKGVAKLTVKSDLLKTLLSKLKEGKMVPYQAIYLKDTVKKTAKVTK
jgi:hypothetical protein